MVLLRDGCGTLGLSAIKWMGLTYCSSNGVDEVLLRVRSVVTALES
jgi:hypothetical protein